MTTIVGAVVVVVIVAAAVFAWNTRPVDIKLNGSTTSVKVGSSLEAIISSKRLSPKTGDLISVGGNVLQQGQGYKFSASVNGQDIDPDDAASYRAADGDDITIGDGANRYEEYDVDIVEEQPKLEMGGDAWGNITYISQWPKVGKHEVRHGKTSGETADGDVLQQTQNCVVTVHQIKPNKKKKKLIALTFDDGPSPQTTAALLDGLKERGAHATFFLIGEQIAGNEAIVRRMKDEGHQIGNHSFTHARLDAADAAALGEIQKTDDALRDVLGDGSYWIRPPWGFASEALKSAVTVPLIFWTLDTMDWSVRSKELVAHHIIENVRTGDIVLLHDLYDTSADAALQVIDVLGAQGYEFVTLEELFACSGVTPQAGHFYLRADEEVSW